MIYIRGSTCDFIHDNSGDRESPLPQVSPLSLSHNTYHIYENQIKNDKNICWSEQVNNI